MLFIPRDVIYSNNYFVPQKYECKRRSRVINRYFHKRQKLDYIELSSENVVLRVRKSATLVRKRAAKIDAVASERLFPIFPTCS